MNDPPNTSQWQRLGALFDQAIGLDGAQQVELLREVEREDAELAKTLASLLDADARHRDRTIEHRERMAQNALDALAVPDLAVGDRVGSYVLCETLGQGGMGMVFRAERADGQVQQQVALKVIQLGMDTRGVIARFAAERQALALMDHPHIARMFDAGATASGRPYFVMELVDGEPISDYCSKRDLSIVQRLQLFEQVCAAVQHAHTKGIIHRDLKPGNVLVSTQDGQPFAKVIDFGIAKATSGRLTDKTLLTEQFLMMGTAQYMSPEQAEGSADIDTRTDIYALGVILYELLTDTTPIESDSLRQAAHAEVQRIIREVDPPRPSERLSKSIQKKSGTNKSGTAKPGDAVPGATAPRRQARTLRGDLDWIVMKALEKDRTRRYETADALAQDVRRYLAGEAVLAAPPGARYRMRKFVHRNKGAVAAGSLIAAALLVGIVAFAWQAQIAQQQTQLARQHASEVEQVAQFEGDMLKQVDPTLAGKQLMDDMQAKLAAALVKAGVPENARTGHIATFAGLLLHVNATDTARDLIDRTMLKPAITAIDKQFRNQPVVAATLDQVLADRYEQMGLYDAAMPLQQRALATRRRVLGEDNPDTLQSIGDLGELLVDQGKLGEAEQYDHEALEKRRRVLGEDAPETLVSLNNLGGLLMVEGKLKEAEPYLREALEKSRRERGEDNEDTLGVINDIAELLRHENKLSEAEYYDRELLEKCRRVLGEENPHTLQVMTNLGVLLQVEEKMSEAEPLLREALDKKRRVLGEEHPATISSIEYLGVVLVSEGKLGEAEPLLREAVDKSRRVFGEEHLKTLNYVSGLGRLLIVQGKYAEAEKLLAPIEAAYRKLHDGTDPSWLAIFLMRLGKARLGQGEFASAQANLLEAQPVVAGFYGPKNKNTLECNQAIIALYAVWNTREPGKGYDAKAADWKKKMDALVESSRQLAGPESPQTKR